MDLTDGQKAKQEADTKKYSNIHFANILAAMTVALDSMKSAKMELHKLSGLPGVELADLAALEEGFDYFIDKIGCFKSVDIERIEAIHNSVQADDPSVLDGYVEANMIPHMDLHTNGDMTKLIDLLVKSGKMTRDEIVSKFKKAVIARNDPRDALRTLKDDAIGSEDMSETEQKIANALGVDGVRVVGGRSAEELLRYLRNSGR